MDVGCRPTERAPGMGLASLVENGPRPVRKGELCTVARIRAKMTPEQRTALTHVLGGAFSSEEIAAELRDDGFDIPAYTLNRHRNGRCRCGGL